VCVFVGGAVEGGRGFVFGLTEEGSLEEGFFAPSSVFTHGFVPGRRNKAVVM